MRSLIIFTAFFQIAASALAQGNSPQNINGVFPNLSIVGANTNRSESGIGALLPWADKLWMVGYVAHISGSRIGLYEISENMTMIKRPESITGTFANRMVHTPSEQGIIGPYFIDTLGNVRTCLTLSKHRLAATMEHLTDPDHQVLFLTMEGLLFEVDVKTLQATQLFNLAEELKIPKGAQPHFKSGFTGNGRVIVCSNSYDERDYFGQHQAGRLAEWNGKTWTILSNTAFVEVSGKVSGNHFDTKSVYGDPIFATGWDKRSVILKCYNDRSMKWKTYRLPKGSHSFDHTWNTEWMRIREAQTERFIMDAFGIFYELPMMTYGGEIWGIKPISYHLRIVPDFCFWRGMFVMAGDQTDKGVGQPQSGLLFQNIDDLWGYGKPQGWGDVWQDDSLSSGQESDPFLMTGFDKKIIHFKNYGNQKVKFKIEIDFQGNNTWSEYKTVSVLPGAYQFEIFPDGYSAHWVRVTVDKTTVATVGFMYN